MKQTSNLNKLRGRVYEKYENMNEFSKAVGMNRSVISCIFSGKRKLNREDILIFCKALDITKNEIADYFFA